MMKCLRQPRGRVDPQFQTSQAGVETRRNWKRAADGRHTNFKPPPIRVYSRSFAVQKGRGISSQVCFANVILPLVDFAGISFFFFGEKSIACKLTCSENLFAPMGW